MNIKNTLLGRLLSKFAKNDTIEDLQNSNSTLRENIIPLLDVMFKEYPGAWNKSFKDQLLRQYESRFNRLFSGRKGKNFLETIYNSIQGLPLKIDEMIKYYENNLNEVEAKDGLTYTKANYIKLHACVTFVTLYLPRLVNEIVTIELLAQVKTVNSKTRNSGDKINIEPSAPFIKKYVEINFDNFASCVNALNELDKNSFKKINELPSIIVDPDTYTKDTSVYKEPLIIGNHGFISPNINPFFWLGNMVAEWQINRYFSNKEEKEVILSKLAYLKHLEVQGEPNAALEKEINYYENQLAKLNIKINDIETKYADKG